MEGIKELNGLSLYYQEINGFTSLSETEELELARKIKNGDTEAKEKFIQANLKLVRYIANMYRNRGIPIDDLIQEGNIGLMIAVDKFDPEKGNRFTTFAVEYINGYIKVAIPKLGNAIKKSGYTISKINKYNKAVAKLAQELNREPTLYEIADKLGITLEEVSEYEIIKQPPVSMNITIGDEEEAEIGDFVADSKVNVEDEVIEQEYRKEIFNFFINSKLTQREKEILYYRMGFDNGKIYKYNEIAKMYNITPERVKQIIEASLKKLFISKDLHHFKNISKFRENKYIYERRRKAIATKLYFKNDELPDNIEYSRKEKMFLINVRYSMNSEKYIAFLELIRELKSGLLKNARIDEISVLVLSLGLVDNCEYANNEIAKMLNMRYDAVRILAPKVLSEYRSILAEKYDLSHKTYSL